MPKEVTKESSINDIVDSLGIKRIGRYPDPVFWEHNGKRIIRPNEKSEYKVVKREFGIDSNLLKFENYYK